MSSRLWGDLVLDCPGLLCPTVEPETDTMEGRCRCPASQLYHGLGLLQAAMMVLLAVLGLSSTENARAQPVTPETAVAACSAVEPWVRALAVPNGAQSLDVAGACVTLRLDGRIVGRGESFGRGPRCLPEAAAAAIAAASALLVTVNDAGADERRILAAEGLTIVAEIAGALVPLDEGSYTEISAAVTPGIEGVAAMMGTEMDAVFPLEMLSSCQQPGSAASRLVSVLTGDAMLALRQPVDLRAGAGVRFFRFSSAAAVSGEHGTPPRALHRGGRLIAPAESGTLTGLRSHAEAVAAFLIRQTDCGVYLPTNASVLELPTSPSRALRAYALSRYASSGMSRSDAAAAAARSELDRLALESSAAPSTRALIAIARRTLGDHDHPDIRAFIAMDETSAASRELAPVAWALAELGERDRAGAILSGLKRVDHAGQLAADMPWLGWAELALADGQQEVAGAVALRDLRRIVSGFQLTAADTGPDQLDLVGGVVFTSGRVPLPTWQTARPLAFAASMLADDRLTTEPERLDATLALASGLRFLRQLTATEDDGWMYPDPAQAEGGVRAAPWDQSMPIDASSVTLLTLIASIESLSELSLPRGEAAR